MNNKKTINMISLVFIIEFIHVKKVKVKRNVNF